jgi:hypothetical protein
MIWYEEGFYCSYQGTYKALDNLGETSKKSKANLEGKRQA